MSECEHQKPETGLIGVDRLGVVLLFGHPGICCEVRWNIVPALSGLLPSRHRRRPGNRYLRCTCWDAAGAAGSGSFRGDNGTHSGAGLGWLSAGLPRRIACFNLSLGRPRHVESQ